LPIAIAAILLLPIASHAQVDEQRAQQYFKEAAVLCERDGVEIGEVVHEQPRGHSLCHGGSLLRQCKLYFNESRPHQGISQRVPANDTHRGDRSKPVVVASVLGGLHVDYRRATQPMASKPDEMDSQHGQREAVVSADRVLAQDGVR
jgi:hypothetical protein